MLAFATTKQLRRYLVTPPAAEPTAAAIEGDETTQAYIMMNVDDAAMRLITNAPSAFHMWEMLEQRHQNYLRPQQVQIQELLFGIRQRDDESVDAYVDRAEELNEQLLSIGAGVPVGTIVNQLVRGLNARFASGRPHLRLNAHTYTIDTLRLALYALESDLASSARPTRAMVAGRHGRVAGSFGRNNGRGTSPSSWNRRDRTPDASASEAFVNHVCHYCGNRGHIAPHCVLRASDRCPNQPSSFADGYPKTKNGTSSDFPVSASISHPYALSSFEWVLDSGATDSMTRERHLLKNYNKFDAPINVIFGNGSSGRALGKGQVQIKTSCGTLFLRDVMYVPSLVSNLLSIRALTATGHSLGIDEHSSVFEIGHGGNLIATATLCDGIYLLDLPHKHVASAAIRESVAMRWHRKLGHTAFGTLAEMKRKLMLPDCPVSPAEFLKARETETCTPCLDGKMQRSCHPTQDVKAPHVNFRVHSDLMVLVNHPTLAKERYVLTLMDEFSGFSLVRLLRSKDDVLTELPSMIQEFATQGGQPVKRIRTDQGGEYVSAALTEVFGTLGIWHEETAGHTPEQNGIAERLNRTLMERARTMLSESGLPASLWGYAILHANNVRNSVIYSPTQRVPFHTFTGVMPSISQFHPWGCDIRVHIPISKRTKLQPKSAPGKYLGTAGVLNSRNVYALVERRILTTCDYQVQDSPPPVSLDAVCARGVGEEQVLPAPSDGALASSPAPHTGDMHPPPAPLPPVFVESPFISPAPEGHMHTGEAIQEDGSDMGPQEQFEGGEAQVTSAPTALDVALEIDTPDPDMMDEIPQPSVAPVLQNDDTLPSVLHDDDMLSTLPERDEPSDASDCALPDDDVLPTLPELSAPSLPQSHPSTRAASQRIRRRPDVLTYAAKGQPKALMTTTSAHRIRSRLQPAKRVVSFQEEPTVHVYSLDLPTGTSCSSAASSLDVRSHPLHFSPAASIARSSSSTIDFDSLPTILSHGMNVVDLSELAEGVAPEDLVPASMEEALCKDNPFRLNWWAAMQEENRSLWSHKCFSFVKAPPGTHTVGCKWVYAVKRPEEGQSQLTFKARLVAQGFSQREGIDYDELFAPVASHTTVRAFLSLANYHDLEIQQIDVKTAFLYGELPENQTVHMKSVPGFPCPAGHVCRLHKSIYGLKQASRRWHQRWKEELLGKGFTPSDSDPALFVKVDKEGKVLALVYVDDCLIAGRTAKQVQQVVDMLKTIFDIKVMGEPKDFLGINIIRNRSAGTLAIHQQPYVEKILRKYGFADCHPSKTPSVHKLSSKPYDDAPALPDQQVQLYPAMVGSLMHLANGTRPDIAQAVNALARHLRAPMAQHWAALVRVFKYLSGTKDLALVYSRDAKEGLIGYTDSDYAGDAVSRRSNTGYIFLLYGAAISWQSRLQPTVALSTTEAEYMAAGAGGREALFLRKLLPTLDYELKGPVHLKGDNQATLCLVKNPMVTARSKHIDVLHHFVQERTERGQLLYSYVDTSLNWADQLTKPLPQEKMERCILGMGLKKIGTF